MLRLPGIHSSIFNIPTFMFMEVYFLAVSGYGDLEPAATNTKLQQPVAQQQQQPLTRDVCNLPITIGTGLYRTPRWGYNPVTRRCEIFYYSGCCGNLNNFPTYQACRDLCEVQVNPCNLPVVGQPPQCQPFNPRACPPDQWCHVGAGQETTVCCPKGPDACTLPLAVGVGTATLPRFYYNGMTQQCVAFTYRGLQGNENNFQTVDECNIRCQPPPINPCATGEPLLDPNGAAQRCNPTSGGASSCPNDYFCHVGASDETTLCCPSTGNPCTLPQSFGTGNASLPRWYFNTGSQSCERFTYTGLQGNQNNFLSQQDCNRACPGDFENPCLGTPALLSTGVPIFCSATNRDTCPVNFWCHVGATARSTLCCPGATNPCSVPLAPGTGNANLGRYYYNADAVSCISFTYNGLGGNQNNFLSLTECEEACPASLQQQDKVVYQSDAPGRIRIRMNENGSVIIVFTPYQFLNSVLRRTLGLIDCEIKKKSVVVRHIHTKKYAHKDAFAIKLLIKKRQCIPPCTLHCTVNESRILTISKVPPTP